MGWFAKNIRSIKQDFNSKQVLKLYNKIFLNTGEL